MGIERFNAPSREAGANAVAVALAEIGKGFLLLSEAVEGLPKPEPVRVERVERWLSPPEVAERMGRGTSLSTVYRLVRQGKLKATRALGGNVIRVAESDLAGFMGIDSTRRITACE
jgi:excisionase family DNA binding protein